MNQTIEQSPDAPTTDVASEAPLVAASALRDPRVPVNMEQLAALRGEAQEIVQARAVVMTTLRTHAIRLTSPEDWLLFKAKDDSVIGYLQDCGGSRVRDLFGIEVFDVSLPQKVNGNTPGEFHYIVTGSGRCRVTGQAIEAIEGGRSSTDDFCNDRMGVALDLAVRKAARANLDGNIVRELAGMESVPLRDLEEAWKGSSKKTSACRLGRGFGTQAERRGAQMTFAGQPAEIEPPICETCGKTMHFVIAGTNRQGTSYKAFWSCPEYKKVNGQPNGHSVINDEAYRRQMAEAAEANAGREPGSDGK